MVHGQSILVTTTVRRTQNALVFKFCAILETIILHNSVNSVIGIEHTFQYVFKSSIDPMFYIADVQTRLGFCMCDKPFCYCSSTFCMVLRSCFFQISIPVIKCMCHLSVYTGKESICLTLLAIWFLCHIFLIMR